MSNTPETLAAILAEMRREAGAQTNPSQLYRYADRIERANVRALALLAEERARLDAKAESEKRWANEYFELARRRENALVHCRQYAQKIERENEEGETRLDAEEIIATVDNEFAGIRPDRAPGNAAAMREALDDTNRLLKHYAERIPMFSDAFAQHIRDNDAALAAPARNCDRFQSFDEALAEFNKTHESLKFCYSELHKWLFAPAEGKETPNA